MSRLGIVLDETLRAERTAALRLLLRQPLVLAAADPEGFANVVRHRGFLADWFGANPGWKLVVEPSAGFARLHKVPAGAEPTRPASLPGRPPFDRRRYALLGLTLAALDEAPAQVTLARLADAVAELSAEEGLRAFDATVLSERRAFVDALRLLDTLGVLRARDGDAERYAASREGDVLYDVNERLLGQLVAAPVPPAWASGPEGLLDEHLPDTEEGRNLRSRQHVLRRLLEDPVLYFDELEPRDFEWLDHSRGWVYRLLEQEVGLPVERRREGLSPVDPEGELTDERFPDGGSTAKHAALLLAAALVARHREGRDEVHGGDVVQLVADLQARHGASCNWSKSYPPTTSGAAHLADDALAILEAFRLVARRDGGRWAIRAAVARFAPGPESKGRRRGNR